MLLLSSLHKTRPTQCLTDLVQVLVRPILVHVGGVLDRLHLLGALQGEETLRPLTLWSLPCTKVLNRLRVGIPQPVLQSSGAVRASALS